MILQSLFDHFNFKLIKIESLFPFLLSQSIQSIQDFNYKSEDIEPIWYYFYKNEPTKQQRKRWKQWKQWNYWIRS